MAYYRSCPDCGAALDPGEHCDCRKNSSQKVITATAEKKPTVRPKINPPRYTRGRRPERRIFDPNCPAFW